MDREGFDPRYSPEFQRGFDPAVHDGPAASPQTHERIPINEDPRGSGVPSLPAGPGSDPPDREVVDDRVPGDDGESPADDAVLPWRNPYLIALTVIGVVLLGAGIGAFRWAVEQVYSAQYGFPGEADDEAKEAFLAAQLAWGLSPLLALAGVLTLVGVFFFVALRWVPRRLPEDDLVG